MSSSYEYSSSDEGSEPQKPEWRPSKPGKSLLDFFSRQGDVETAKSMVRGAKRLSLFHGNDGALILSEQTVRTRGWTPAYSLLVQVTAAYISAIAVNLALLVNLKELYVAASSLETSAPQ